MLWRCKVAWLVLSVVVLSALADEPRGGAPAGDASPWFGVAREHASPMAGALAAPYFFDKERGWFWYERELEPLPEEAEASAPEPAKPTLKGPEPLTAEWFRKNLEKYRDKAVDEPTQENVKAYLYLQRVMLDKASRFSEVSQAVSMSDPILDENARRPIATFGSMEADKLAVAAKDKAARKLAKMAGLWFVFESTCQFCEKQAGVLKGLENAYGFKVLPIALDGAPLPGNPFPNFVPDRGQSKMLGVEMTPAFFLVRPGGVGGVLSIAQGLVAGDEIIRRAVTQAHEKGWLTDREFDSTKAAKPLMVDPDLGKQLTPETLNNPASIAEQVRENLKKQIRLGN